jgi:hypothetical protein
MSVTSGWGRLTYGQANWNQATTLKTGWGAQAWNGGGAWGQTSNQVITLTGQSISSSLGSPTVVDMTVGLSGQSVTSSQGTAFNPVVVSATASVGSLTVEEGLGLTGQSFSASVGSISLADMQVGLTGQSATFNLGTVNIFAYGDVDTGSNTSYTNVSTGSNDTYSDVATGSNTSYSDAA